VTENLPDSEIREQETREQEAREQTQPVHPLVAFTDEDLAALLNRAVRITAVLGAVVAALLALALGWRNGVLFAVGAGISVASIYEWARLIRLFNAKLDQQKTPRGAGLVVSLFLLRLILIAGVIYGSLKCFHTANSGSPIALGCGLMLALVGLIWEVVRLIRT